MVEVSFAIVDIKLFILGSSTIPLVHAPIVASFLGVISCEHRSAL